LRFTIRSLMLAVAAIAGFAALLLAWGSFALIGLVLYVPIAALISGLWFVSRGQRKLAAFWFGAVATSINLFYFAACITPRDEVLKALLLAWIFICIPTVAALGIPWATTATGQLAIPRRNPLFTCLLVLFIAVAPLFTVITLWPLRLLFIAARPAMESFADQAAAGQPLNGPRWIGVFRLAGSTVDSASGEVRFLVSANPNGHARFRRRALGQTSAGPDFPLLDPYLSVHLTGDWWYEEDD
jgi:hypothetical protein